MIRKCLLLFAIAVLAACAANPPQTAAPPAETSAPAPAATDTVAAPPTEILSPTLEPASGLDDSPPGQPVKLVFIHHSSGENWLADENGGLGLALMQNNYYVSDTYYEWGPVDPLLSEAIGNHTDIGNWWNWFLGPSSGTVWSALMADSEEISPTFYSRLATDPGGPNTIVMFKSCFPNSALEGNPDDPPTTGVNPLEGQGADSGYLTVANAKGVYVDLLAFFAAHPDTLFVAVTAPPLQESDTTPEQAANARAFNRWLVEDWLADYPAANVAVFDFYNVLTSNGGGVDLNDAGSAEGNHHRYRNGQIEYVTDQGSNFSAYPSGDSHPTAAGNQKATAEFVPLLNIFYHRWVNSR